MDLRWIYDFFLWSQFLPNTLLSTVKYNMFKMAISFCDLDHLLWTLSIPADAFIVVYFIDVNVASRDFFSLLFFPDKSSSILLPSIYICPHALGVS